MKRVLVVDDNLIELRMLQFLLRSFHMEARFAITEEEALSLFQSWGADLVLLDMHLDRMDGVELATRIRKMGEVPVVFLSSDSFYQAHPLLRGITFSGYLQKPISLSKLFEVLVTVLGTSILAEGTVKQVFSDTPAKVG